jgi:hypothetical protein
LARYPWRISAACSGVNVTWFGGMPRSSRPSWNASSGAPAGRRGSSGGSFARSYKSQYRLGALNGACGFQNPTARKNGLSFTSAITRTASAAIRPS